MKTVSEAYYKTGQKLAALEREWAEQHKDHKKRIRAIRSAMRRMEEEGDQCLMDLFNGGQPGEETEGA